MDRIPGGLRGAIPLLVGFLLYAADTAGAQSCSCDVGLCCPEVGEYELTFSRQFSGDYRNGEPLDILTVAPGGGLETWESAGIVFRVRMVCSCEGLPLAGIPAQQIVLFSSSLCYCGGGIVASQDTDANGWTEFHGAASAGGCAQQLTLFLDGIAIRTFPIKTNSPDSSSGMNCGVDSSDLAAFAAVLGNPAQYTICRDFNESGTIDASDLAHFAAVLGAQCE